MINFGEAEHKLITFVTKRSKQHSNFGMQLCVTLADLSENLHAGRRPCALDRFFGLQIHILVVAKL